MEYFLRVIEMCGIHTAGDAKCFLILFIPVDFHALLFWSFSVRSLPEPNIGQYFILCISIAVDEKREKLSLPTRLPICVKWLLRSNQLKTSVWLRSCNHFGTGTQTIIIKESTEPLPQFISK